MFSLFLFYLGLEVLPVVAVLFVVVLLIDGTHNVKN